MNKAFLALFSVLGFAAPAQAAYVDADFSAVSGTLASGYTIDVPTLGDLSFIYTNHASPLDGYSTSGSPFPGGPNFVIGPNTVVTVSAIGFDLASAIFEIWDLDTNSVGTETVTFNGGNMMTGVAFNIPNTVAYLSPVFSAAITPNASGSIIVAAGSAGAAFAVGGLQVLKESTDIPAPAPLALLALGVAGMLPLVARKRRSAA